MPDLIREAKAKYGKTEVPMKVTYLADQQVVRCEWAVDGELYATSTPVDLSNLESVKDALFATLVSQAEDKVKLKDVEKGK